MDTHDWMLGLVDGRRENFLEMLPLFSGGARAHRCVVIGIAVNGPQIVCQQFERCWQTFVCGMGVGPDRITSGRRNDDTAKDREFWIGIHEGDIGVPLVRPAAAAAGIEIEDGSRAGHRALGWMRHKAARAACEGFLFWIVKMVTVAEEDDLVFQEKLVDGCDRRVRKVSAEANTLISAPTRPVSGTTSDSGMI